MLLMPKFNFDSPSSGRSHVWIYLGFRDLFYPMIVNVDHLEEYAMDRRKIKMLVIGILNIFLDTEFVVK